MISIQIEDTTVQCLDDYIRATELNKNPIPKGLQLTKRSILCLWPHIHPTPISHHLTTSKSFKIPACMIRAPCHPLPPKRAANHGKEVYNIGTLKFQKRPRTLTEWLGASAQIKGPRKTQTKTWKIHTLQGTNVSHLWKRTTPQCHPLSKKIRPYVSGSLSTTIP